MRELKQIQPGTIVPIDGKTMRGTANPSQGKEALHIVSAWCSHNKLLLGQIKTHDKSNEIAAIPEILEMLFLKGTVITIDAMLCKASDNMASIVTMHPSINSWSSNIGMAVISLYVKKRLA